MRRARPRRFTATSSDPFSDAGARCDRYKSYGVRVLYIGLGSNLGDRQANVLAALQRLRAKGKIVSTSGLYATVPEQGAEGPEFLNAAAIFETELGAAAFEEFAREVERSVGRTLVRKLSARLIDIDLLGVAGEFVRDDLPLRPFNLVPLAEIAGDLTLASGSRLADLAGALQGDGIRKKVRALQFSSNRQEDEPEIRLSVNRAGVSSLRRVIHLEIDGRQRVYNAEFAMVADLAPDKAGVHMSRFSEILEEATLEVLARPHSPSRIETLVESIALQIVRNHAAVRADVRLRAQFALERWTPVSGKRGEETYTLVGIAHAGRHGARRVIGIEAEGMTACPCAQSMVREHSMHELKDAGFSPAQAQRALDVLPGATHNQRGRGSILLGVEKEHEGAVRLEDLVEIVENSMSSETYDLLKRSDEFFVVNKAHRNPKFVEDVVRGILARTLDSYGDLPDGTFVSASQVNYESIHKHDAFAEAFGTFGELRAELATATYQSERTGLAAWLGTRHSAVLAAATRLPSDGCDANSISYHAGI